MKRASSIGHSVRTWSLQTPTSPAEIAIRVRDLFTSNRTNRSVRLSVWKQFSIFNKIKWRLAAFDKAIGHQRPLADVPDTWFIPVIHLRRQANSFISFKKIINFKVIAAMNETLVGIGCRAVTWHPTNRSHVDCHVILEQSVLHVPPEGTWCSKSLRWDLSNKRPASERFRR